MPLHSHLDYPLVTSDFPSVRIPTSDILTTFSFEYTPSVSVTSQPITLISASFEILIEERAQTQPDPKQITVKMLEFPPNALTEFQRFAIKLWVSNQSQISVTSQDQVLLACSPM